MEIGKPAIFAIAIGNRAGALAVRDARRCAATLLLIYLVLNALKITLVSHGVRPL